MRIVRQRTSVSNANIWIHPSASGSNENTHTRIHTHHITHIHTRTHTLQCRSSVVLVVALKSLSGFPDNPKGYPILPTFECSKCCSNTAAFALALDHIYENQSHRCLRTCCENDFRIDPQLSTKTRQHSSRQLRQRDHQENSRVMPDVHS